MKKTLFDYKIKFFNKFDKNKIVGFSRIIVIFVFLIFILNFIVSTLSKYESSSSALANANVAMYMVDAGYYSKTISLGKLVPRDSAYVYSFYVSNNKNGKRSNVDLDYSLYFKVSTNLPLTYEIYKNENYLDNGATNVLSSSSVYRDDDGSYYKKLEINNAGSFSHSSDQSDVYNLVVRFPSSYKTMADKYEGSVELVTLVVSSEQSI